MNSIKKIVARMSPATQSALRRLHYKRQIAKGQFETPEVEYQRLAEWVKPCDWVVDLGANIGHYTFRLSKLVGANGRVISLEPVAETFAHLCANCAADNVTLINAAASDQFRALKMSIPVLADSGLPNHYQAEIAEAGTTPTLAIAVDFLNISERIALIKIDVEGHEVQAIDGAWTLICRDKPVLIVEHPAQSAIEKLKSIGYSVSREGNSPNKVFEFRP